MIFFNKNTLLILGILLGTPLSIFAQKKPRKQKKDEAYTSTRGQLESIPIHVAALGSTDYKGVKIGFDYPLKISELRGFKHGGFAGQRVISEQYLSADFSYNHFDGNHENLSVSGEWTLRFINGQGFFFQVTPLSIGVNYLIKPLFNLESNLQRDTHFMIDKIGFTPSVSAGLGYDFAFRRAQNGRPFSIYLRGGVAAFYPYKKLFYLYPTFELAFAVRFRSLSTLIKKTRRD